MLKLKTVAHKQSLVCTDLTNDGSTTYGDRRSAEKIKKTPHRPDRGKMGMGGPHQNTPDVWCGVHKNNRTSHDTCISGGEIVHHFCKKFLTLLKVLCTSLQDDSGQNSQKEEDANHDEPVHVPVIPVDA